MSTYTPTYEKPYPDGWRDKPEKTTVVTARIMDNYDNAIENIENYLSKNPIESDKNAVSEIDASVSDLTLTIQLKDSNENVVSEKSVTLPSAGASGGDIDLTDLVVQNSISLGRKADTTIGEGSTAQGGYVTASGPFSHAEGQNTTASAPLSHAEGLSTTASGMYSHAEGQSTTASGSASHAEGGETTASGMYSHAEGNGAQAVGSASHAEGDNTKANKSYSHAEGMNSEANGQAAHAEGQQTAAEGISAHAEGYNTKAIGNSSHAEGGYTTSNKTYAHAEGNYTTASGEASHAEGYQTKANGDYAHAEGEGTLASMDRQHVQGKYNVEDTQKKYAHIVGGGSSEYNRRNIHTLDWQGNAEFAGNVTNGDGISLNGLKSDLDKVSAIAGGASIAKVFNTKSDLDEWIAVTENSAVLKIGQNIYIKEKDTPDYWWDGEQLQELETGKIEIEELSYDETMAILNESEGA